MSLGPVQLSALRDNLVAQFHRAASLHVTDPNRHVRGLVAGDLTDPVITAKRIVCATVILTLNAVIQVEFEYLGAPRLELGRPRTTSRLEEKLEHAGLTDIVEYMKARETAAEYHFLQDLARDPQSTGRLLRQIEESVHGECLEAFMSARATGEPFGQHMFNDITGRLRHLEKERSDLIGGRPYEILMGTAALLTSACRVWWSERFPLLGEGE